MKGIHPLLALLALFVAFVFIVVGLLFFRNAPITNYPPHGTNIIALGDSLTSGVGASTKETNYVGVLEKRLNITIRNAGVPGNTTRDALLRLDRDVLIFKPNIVIVFLGGNDVLQQIPSTETFGNLKRIIGEIQASGAVVILIGVPSGLMGDKNADEFKTLADKTGSLYVENALQGIIGNPKLLFDEVHPNDAGYMRVADKIAPILEGLVLAGGGTVPHD